MNQPIFFSIVVPTYNRAHIISRTVESILSQTYSHFEIIIVDDGSKDNTEEVIRKYLSDRVRYYKKENAERAAARNFGTNKSKGDYINWFDSDDIMFSDHLEEAAKTIRKYNDPEIFALPYQHQTPSGKVLGIFTFPPDINAEEIKGNLIGNSPVMVRRDIALANPYNEDRGLSGSEDYELWLRLASKYKIYSASKITIGSIYHEGNSTITMADPDQLITRYTKFIHYTTSNPEIIAFLGRQKDAFMMKNYLLLAVDLIINSHVSLATKYLIISFKHSPKIVFELGFYAFIKYYLRHFFIKNNK